MKIQKKENQEVNYKESLRNRFNKKKNICQTQKTGMNNPSMQSHRHTSARNK